MPDTSSAKKWHFLLITLLTLSVFFLLFIFRSIDNNRLTSWQWTFANVNLLWFIPTLFSGIITTYMLFRLPFAEQKPSLFLLIFSFAVSTIFWKSPEVIIDASRYFTQAKHLEIYGIKHFITEWGKTINIWTDLPLIPSLFGLIFRVFGESRIFIQVFISLLFSMTIVFTYLIGKTLWDEHIGFFAGALLLGIPYIFSQIPLMLVDIPTMFFLILSVFTFIKAMEKGGAWIVYSSITVFCAIFSKYSTWMMLSVLFIIFLVYLIQSTTKEFETQNPKPKTREYITRCALIVFIASLLIGIVALFKFDVIYRQIQFLWEYQVPGLKRWSESFISTFFYQTHPFITIATLYSLYIAVKKRDLKFLIICWLIFIIVFFQIKRSRYMMIAFPLFTLMASYGLQNVKKIELKRYIVSCAVAASLVVAVFAYLPFLKSISTVNLKNAGIFLNSIDTEKIDVFTIHSTKTIINQAVSVPILDLFTNKKIFYHHDASFTLPFEKIKESPLRFTWEYKNPQYYIADPEDPGGISVIALISNGPIEVIPDYIKGKIKGHKTKIFKVSTGVFRFSPVVTILLSEKT